MAAAQASIRTLLISRSRACRIASSHTLTLKPSLQCEERTTLVWLRDWLAFPLFPLYTPACQRIPVLCISRFLSAMCQVHTGFYASGEFRPPRGMECDPP